MYKIVLDTNVLISGIVFGGKPRIILEDVIERKFKLAVSEPILEEIQVVLEGKKFQYPPQITHNILNEIITISEFVNPKIKINIIKKDPDDNKILECALEYEADFIISGDAHLLKIEKFKNIRIINPADFIDEIMEITNV